MSGTEGVNGGFWGVAYGIQNMFSWLLDGPRQLLNDSDATTDLLKLVQRVNGVFDQIIELVPLKLFVEGVTAITEFANVRSIVSGLHDLFTGKAAWETPFCSNFPDLLKVASKMAFVVGDMASVATWLSSLHILGDWVRSSTAQIASWGKKFNVMQGIGDASCITGCLLNIADTVRLILKENLTEGHFKTEKMRWRALADHVVEIASDVSGIAAAILSNIPGVPAVLAIISLAIGSTFSLGRFFMKIYWKEPAPQKV
jgi:hypothetical protein